MILNCVICSSIKELGDFSPFIPCSSMMKVKNPFFVIVPPNFLNFRV